MLAARIFKENDLRVVQVPSPPIVSPDQVRVRISSAGICGSDLHVYRTGAYLSYTPITMGHEFAGRVVEAGENSRGIKAGDQVVGDSRVSCGRCEYCLEGHYNLCETLGFLGEVCEGAFAEEIVVHAGNLLKISETVPGHIAALAEPLAVALHAINQSRLPGAKKILILGAGPIGALIHAALRVQGLDNLTVVDSSEYRRQTLEPVDGQTRIVSEPDDQYDLVFETTGAVPVIKKILPKSLLKRGQAVLVGLYGEEIPFNFTDIVEKEWQIKGCSCFDTELGAAVEMLEKRHDDFAHLVSHRLPLSQAGRGFELLLAREKAAMKVMLEPLPAQ